MKFLITGLGNIGTDYIGTRHNIGFMVLEALANKYHASFSVERYASITSIKHKNKSAILCKPTTYVNLSGKAVRYWLEKEKIEVSNLLIIVDDISLPFSTIRIKPNGSDAGHNGLISINESLGHNNYARLRFGIGNNFPKGAQAHYVLSHFNDEEAKFLPKLLDKSANAIITYMMSGINMAMNEFNKRKPDVNT